MLSLETAVNAIVDRLLADVGAAWGGKTYFGEPMTTPRTLPYNVVLLDDTVDIDLDAQTVNQDAYRLTFYLLRVEKESPRDRVEARKITLASALRDKLIEGTQYSGGILRKVTLGGAEADIPEEAMIAVALTFEVTVVVDAVR